MTHPTSATFRDRPFFDLLADALFQHQKAEEAPDSYTCSRFARASITASALSIECFANCLLSMAELPKKLAEEVDKLAALPKIDVALRFLKREPLDRGRTEVQKIMELASARNVFVHPKISTIKVDIDQPVDAGDFWHVPTVMMPDRWQALGIPKQAMFWFKDNSRSTLLAIRNFYCYVLIELMKADETEMNLWLISRYELGNSLMPAVYDEFVAELVAALKYGVDFSFFGLKSSS